MRKYVLLLICISIAHALFASGGKEPAKPAAPATASLTFVRSEPGAKPDWADTTPKSSAELFFIGVSPSYGTAPEARNDARENAFNQIVKYYGEFIQQSGRTRITTTGTSSETLDPFILDEKEITSFAQAVVSQFAADKYYTEVYLNGWQEIYIVYVLCQIPRQKAEQEIQNFAKNISERYTNLFAQQLTLAATLKVYASIYESLRVNPLHRAVAYYDSANGRVMLSGGNNTVPTVLYTVGQNNTFLLQIHTEKLNAGR